MGGKTKTESECINNNVEVNLKNMRSHCDRFNDTYNDDCYCKITNPTNKSISTVYSRAWLDYMVMNSKEVNERKSIELTIMNYKL